MSSFCDESRQTFSKTYNFCVKQYCMENDSTKPRVFDTLRIVSGVWILIFCWKSGSRQILERSLSCTRSVRGSDSLPYKPYGISHVYVYFVKIESSLHVHNLQNWLFFFRKSLIFEKFPILMSFISRPNNS